MYSQVCNLKMSLNLELFMKLGKNVLTGMVLDYKSKFDTTQSRINKELTDRRSKFTTLEFGLALGK